MRPADLDPDRFVEWLRQAAPYIHAHRGRTFVIAFPGAAVKPPGVEGLVHDIALLAGLGVRVVLVPGARPQIVARMAARGLRPVYAANTGNGTDTDSGSESGLRVTDAEALECVKEAVGEVRLELEARLSTGIAATPMAGMRLRVASGNVITARPVGVRHGVDHGYTGEVRRVDTEALRRRLDGGDVALVAPLGYSPTGEVFNLSAEAVARAVAGALGADKLIHLADGLPVVHPESGEPIPELTPGEARELIHHHGTALPPSAARLLAGAVHACAGGVGRVHLLDQAREGALLLELFTRDGVGTLVTPERFETVRRARLEDIPAILALTRPLEARGALLQRPRELLETQIDHFTVIERDGAVIATAALLPYPGERAGEIACVAVDPDYQGEGRAEALVERLERDARRMRLERLVALTTEAEHFFRERGFEPAGPEILPEARRALYDAERNSKILLKIL